jgi:hypothetical protein
MSKGQIDESVGDILSNPSLLQAFVRTIGVPFVDLDWIKALEDFARERHPHLDGFHLVALTLVIDDRFHKQKDLPKTPPNGP